MAEHQRIEELRRRVQADPTSIAFAALAEEYRRGGQYEEAVEVCRTGLARHPAYLSARVTLGRALIELNQLDEARMELEQVLSIAPENLVAIRALGELRAREGDLAPAAASVLSSTVVGNGGFELDLMPASAPPPPEVDPEEPGVQADAPGPPGGEQVVALDPALPLLQRLLEAVLERRSRG